MPAKEFKLPTNVRPINYELSFQVDLSKFRFSCKEVIHVNIARSTSVVKLNADDLDIKGVRLVHNNKIIKPKVKFDKEREILEIAFNEKIKGNAKLLIDFSGKLNDNLLGFYRSKYVQDGETRYLATTQFEAPYARRCFPCFDEPEYKATFNVSMEIDKNLQAVSNMPIKQEIIRGGKKTVQFEATPKMSTYLLYLGVGDFEFLEDRLGSIEIRFVSVPGKKDQGMFALSLAKKFLDFFQKYSGVPYPLPKLDIIALPDFIVGAMENWGAITFRELYLLYDTKTTSTAVKKRIAMIIAHELWHQWSGDLVTMKWWNDLWLNESFATFMAYKAVNAFFPEWEMWEEFIRDETERALDDDSLKATHPIDVKVENPHQIEELFDAISYSKGGSILRMIEKYLGEETFRKGVSNYLSQNKYSNATSEDLWVSLSKVSNQPVKKIMSSWIKQAGYPLVGATRQNNKLILSQHRFVFNQTDNKTKWMIPVVIKADNSSDPLAGLLDKKEKQIRIDQSISQIKINYNQTGFYRVKYPDAHLANLLSFISMKHLSSLDRWGIQNDYYKMCLNGDVQLDKYLEFLKSYRNDDNFLVLSSIYGSLRNIYFVFSREAFWQSIWPGFKEHFKEPFRKLFDKLGWNPREGESQHDALLRDISIKYLAFAEDGDVVKIGIEKFEGYVSKQADLHPDVKPAVFYIAAMNGNERTYQELLDVYSKTQIVEEKRLVLTALGQFKKLDILKKVLEFSLSDKVRTQDAAFIIASVSSNPIARELLFSWVKSKWKKLESYQKAGQLFINILEAFVSSYVTKEDERELRKFFKSHPVKYKMTLNRAFERMKRNIHWLESNKEVLNRYFS
ncbi:MAG: M1 family metallopeptidase [Candidatus Aenigmarchaeota archaeon]|nr:M1 family metallopeptidase [Candidatus Aenigmarchaeota archaeon]